MNGNKIFNKKTRFYLLSLFFFLNKIVFSQVIIKGLVTTNKNQPLPYVSVLVKKDSTTILSYTYSNEKGYYTLPVKEKGNYMLVFSALGYKKEKRGITITSETKEIIKNVILQEKAFQLDEIIIQSEKPIKVKKDTITFKVSSFLQGNEAVVEDLLKKIPGLQISSDGTIKVGNQEIEKIMVDGDDLFEKGYKILSKNMPPTPIEKIQILKRYSNNKLLKGIENSKKVALNLVLKEKAKSVWFGNIGLGYGLGKKNRHQISGNLMNFGKKKKYYFLTNFNNTGYDATGDINHLIRPMRFGEPASIGDSQSVKKTLYLSAFTPNFKDLRTNFNNAELVSLNAIFKVSKKTKLKTLFFLNSDTQDYFRNNTQNYIANGTNFTNTTNFELKKNKKIGFGQITITTDISKTKLFESVTKFNQQNDTDKSSLLFNTQQTAESLKNNNTLFDQKIMFTNKFKPKNVFLLTGRYINEKTPQNYSINTFLYQNLFPNFAQANNVVQLSENNMQFIGIEGHLLNRKENTNLFEIQIGNQFRKDKLISSFSLKQEEMVINNPQSYQNNTDYSTNNLYVKTKYRIELESFSITGKLGVHQLFNRLEILQKKQQTPFFINPSLGFEWRLNNKNKLTTSYNHTTKNTTILDVYDSYILTGFRSFTKGTGNFNQLTSSSFSMNYELGNWSDKFFANTFLFYSKNYDFFSNHSMIHQNYTQSEKILVKDRNYFTVSSKIDYYLQPISSNFKVNIGYSTANYKNKINNNPLYEVISENYNYGFELRSGFSGVFNYHIGTKWRENKIISTFSNSYTNNESFLNLFLDFNSKFNVELETERYYFGNINTGKNTYYFADLTATYKAIKNKLTVSLSGKNLFNTETFRTYSISDISTSITEYRLLPRYILLKMEYRF